MIHGILPAEKILPASVEWQRTGTLPKMHPDSFRVSKKDGPKVARLIVRKGARGTSRDAAMIAATIVLELVLSHSGRYMVMAKSRCRMGARVSKTRQLFN